MGSNVSFQILNRSQLVNEVVVQLQKKISSGEIKIGDKIPTEPVLMEQFGVGRSTVREATRVLVHAGLLEKKQGLGTYLKANPMSHEPLGQRLQRAEILEVYEVRRMLELGMAKLAAERREDSDLALMRQHLDNRMLAIEQRKVEDYLTADILFHQAVATASKNAVVVDLYKTFASALREAFDKLVTDLDTHDPHVLFHENLFEAIEKQDAAAAVHWTLQNLDETVMQLKEM
jgi:GntR family transcriptional repressor for pyruvate dehydrogenase complex